MLHHFNHKATKHIEAECFKVLPTNTWMFLLSWCACEVWMNFELNILEEFVLNCSFHVLQEHALAQPDCLLKCYVLHRGFCGLAALGEECLESL